MILVVKNGDIIEQGNHEELLKKNGGVLALLQKSRGLLWGGGLGLAYALALLGFQLANGGVPDGAQLARLALVVLAGAAGGSAGVRGAGKKHHR